MLFPSIDVYFYWLAKIIEIYNRPFTACIVKTATEFNVVFYFEKSVTVFFVRVRHNYSGNLVFRTAVAEDTNLTLASIPDFKYGIY